MTNPVTTQRRAMPGISSPADVSVYFVPPSQQLLGGRLFERESNPYAGDRILAPYAALHERLSREGFVVDTVDRLPEPAGERHKIVISYGIPDRMPSDSVRRFRELAAREDVTLSAFVAMECPIVEPGMYEVLPEMQQLFRRVLSWSDSASLLPFTHQPVHFDPYCRPQSFEGVHEHLWSGRDRKFLVLMNANKLPRLQVDELYTARRLAVAYFHQFREIDLYGRHWDKAPRRVGKTRTPATIRRIGEHAWELWQRVRPDPIYRAAAEASRGPALSKSETMAQYRFAICFENSILKGWITEKLFDCFFIGTVPVYWGAPDILDWVPAECFIDMRQFDGFADLRAFLHAMTPDQEQGYRDAARAFLASDRFTPFRIATWVDLHARIIAADTGLVV
jgi:hypothetical protein